MKEIEIRNLFYAYPSGRVALSGLNLDVALGQSVALIGQNGAGKSTFLTILMGFIKPSEGSVKIGGLAMSDKNLKEIRKKIGFVFQNSDDQLFMPTIYEDVAFGLRNLGLPEDEVAKRAADALEKTNICHLKDIEPYNLSAGEKRRAAIAGVIAMAPEILVMDEPTTGLDHRSRRQLINILKEINCTKIIATHDINFAKELCDKIVVLDDGKIVGEGKTDEVLSNEPLLTKYGFEI